MTISQDIEAVRLHAFPGRQLPRIGLLVEPAWIVAISTQAPEPKAR